MGLELCWLDAGLIVIVSFVLCPMFMGLLYQIIEGGGWEVMRTSIFYLVLALVQYFLI